MNRRFSRALSVSVVAALFSGCGGPQGGPNFAGTIPSAGLRSLSFHAKCHGSGHVRAKPCPITLDNVSGVEVGITGQDLTKAWVFKSCGAICVTQRLDNFHFQVTPGVQCGTTKMEFRAFRAGNQIAGIADLTVTNKVCKPATLFGLPRARAPALRKGYPQVSTSKDGKVIISW